MGSGPCSARQYRSQSKEPSTARKRRKTCSAAVAHRTESHRSTGSGGLWNPLQKSQPGRQGAAHAGRREKPPRLRVDVHMASEAHIQGGMKLGVVQIENVKHQHLQGIGGDEAMVRPQQPALVVAPGLELQMQGEAGVELRSCPNAPQSMCLLPIKCRTASADGPLR